MSSNETMRSILCGKPEIDTSGDKSSIAPEMSETTVSSTHSAASNEDRPEGSSDPLQSSEVQTLMLTQLARQLEYYFSTHNLSRDTYVRTLRELNDGCVPVSILVNFSKVKVIVASTDEEVLVHAILQAAGEYSELLEVNSIETATGQIATDDTPSSATTILAVGPQDKRPIELTPDAIKKSVSIESFGSIPGSSGKTSNTVILRDVVKDVTEDEVRTLFAVEGFPQIASVQADVASCWFVTLDTDSRDEMVKVMMHIRSQSLRGHHVHARLKASATAPFDAAPPATIFSGYPAAIEQVSPSTQKKKKKKQQQRKKSKKGNSSKKQHQKQSQMEFETMSTPPSLGEEDFPTLQDKKVEWDTMPVGHTMHKNKSESFDEDAEDDGENRPSSTKSLSDAASTATTTSSSLDSVRKITLGGYAAALRKAPSPTTITETPKPVESPQEAPQKTAQKKRRAGESKKVSSGKLTNPHRDESLTATVVVTPPTWGRGRSFADIVRD